MTNKLIIGGVALAVVLSLMALTKEPQKIIEQIVGAQSSSVTDGDAFMSPQGVRVFDAKVSMANGTTTVCSIKSPSATSTLTFATAYFGTSSSTAATLFMSQNKMFSGTTTPTTQIASQLITATAAANQIGVAMSVVATSTSAGVAAGFIFPPNSFLNVAMAGGIGTFSPTGNCVAEFVY